jgi:hypothetical protein
MRPLLNLTGVTFVVLQAGPARSDIVVTPLPSEVIDLGEELDDLATTTAIMSELDLVISFCTAPLHLAGARGVTTWALLPSAPYTSRPRHRLFGRKTGGWYLIDFARSRHANPSAYQSALRAAGIIPAARKIDPLIDGRAAGILLIPRAAATPTLRAYQSALRAAGITSPGCSIVPTAPDTQPCGCIGKSSLAGTGRA